MFSRSRDKAFQPTLECRRFVSNMVTKVIAALVVIGLAVGVWWLWPRDDPISPSSTTLPSAQGSTTDPAETTTTTSSVTSTTVMDSESHVVETVEEAEEILRELWFGWFEGIYNQDEDRIREVVATDEFLKAGVEAFDALEFTSPPSRQAIRFLSADLLLASDQCTAIWSISDAEFRAAGPARHGVEILRRVDEKWKLLSSWAEKEDLWEADCDTQLD